MWRGMLCVALVAACTKKNPNYCGGDEDCDDPTRPFCDVNGEFAESGHTANKCSIVPANCPLERCGCTPGAALSCSGDQVVTCNADGATTSTSSCALGCSDTETRCATFTPSNGLGGVLAGAAAEPDVILPKGATIDTDGGVVRTSGGVVVPVTTQVVNGIRVLVAKSFVIDDLRATGDAPLAFVASGKLLLTGLVDVSAHMSMPGPGAHFAGACIGGDSNVESGGGLYGRGAGGGGHATSGGAGGADDGNVGPAGGSSFGAITPLSGGCRGGDVVEPDQSIYARGGGGGGGIELVSGTSIEFSSTGFVSAGGGGAAVSSGGGSGGLVLVEAPTVAFSGVGSGITTNGGSGGCPKSPGVDGPRSTSPAQGCNTPFEDGGTGTTPAQPGYLCIAGGPTHTFCIVNEVAPGGGGAGGAVQISTASGTYDATKGPILSSVIATLKLVID